MNTSLADTSMYTAQLKKPLVKNSSTMSPLKVIPTQKKFVSEKKSLDNRYSRTKNSTMPSIAKNQNMQSSELAASTESPVKIKIRSRRTNNANSKVLQMLSTDAPKEDEGKYMATKDLESWSNPELEFKQVYKDLLSSDWQKQIESCNRLRALAVHHKDILLKDWIVTRVFIQGLLKQLQSLRSTVSKNALLGFKDMIETLKGKFDNELDYILPNVMKKATDTNVFLSRTAESVLLSIANNWSEIKVINALGSVSNSKVPSTKVKMQVWLEMIIKKLGTKLLTFKHNMVVMNYLTSYLTDASEKVREKAKSLLDTLKQTLSTKNLEKLIRNTCNDQQEKRINGFYEGGNRSSMSEAATSKTYFNRNKSTMNRRNITSSSRYVARNQIKPNSNDNYTQQVIPDLHNQKRVSSVLKTYPKKLNL